MSDFQLGTLETLGQAQTRVCLSRAVRAYSFQLAFSTPIGTPASAGTQAASTVLLHCPPGGVQRRGAFCGQREAPPAKGRKGRVKPGTPEEMSAPH